MFVHHESGDTTSALQLCLFASSEYLHDTWSRHRASTVTFSHVRKFVLCCKCLRSFHQQLKLHYADPEKNALLKVREIPIPVQTEV